MKAPNHCYPSDQLQNEKGKYRARDLRLEPIRFWWNQNRAPIFYFDAFSSREPVPTSLENALILAENGGQHGHAPLTPRERRIGHHGSTIGQAINERWARMKRVGETLGSTG
jgi:hypothetical protein